MKLVFSDDAEPNDFYQAVARGIAQGEEDKEDIFIPAVKTAGALDGDLVLVALPLYANGRQEGRVEKILQSAPTPIIGTLASARVSLRLKPSNSYVFS